MPTGNVPSLLAKISAMAAAFAMAGCGPLARAERAAVERGLNEDYGLAPSELLANGLSANGISATAFQTWFNQDTAAGDAVMTFLVRCAVSSGQSRSWTNPVTGNSYRWTGVLGLAPDWAGGSPATAREKKAVTACLAAHVKKLGGACKATAEGGLGFRSRACLARLPVPAGQRLQAAGQAGPHAAPPGG